MLFHHVTLSLTPLCGAARKEDSRMSEEVIVRLGAPHWRGSRQEACSPVRILPAKAWKNLCGALTAALLERALPAAGALFRKERSFLSVPPGGTFPRSAKQRSRRVAPAGGLPCESLRKMSCSLRASCARRRRVPARDRAVSQLSPEDVKRLYRKSRRQLQAQRPVEGLRRREEKRKSFFAKYKNARTSIANGTKPVMVSPSSPSRCDAPERKILL